MISIRAGTLDDPSLYQPRAEVFVSQAYAWDTLNQILDILKNDREEQEIKLN